MFLLETARRRSSSRTLNFEDYLQESLILEEEWSMITERTMTKQHIALTERSNRLLNESIRDGYEKVKEWFKKAWVAIKKFFKWLFQYIAGFVANKSKWVMRNKRLIISGADRLDSKDKKLEIPEALYNAIKGNVAYNLNKETYKEAVKVMDGYLKGALSFVQQQTGSDSIDSTKEKAENAIKDMMSDVLGEYTYGGIAPRAVDRVSKMNQTKSIYKAWDRLFDRGYKGALAAMTKYYNDLDKLHSIPAKIKGESYENEAPANIATFKKDWTTARSLLNLSWRLENKVSKEAFKICRRCFNASKIKDY